MAKINNIVKGVGNVSNRITEVECVYNVGEVNGEKLVAFSTYGSKTRKTEGIASQVLHIDKKSAVQIVEILKKEFNIN